VLRGGGLATGEEKTSPAVIGEEKSGVAIHIGVSGAAARLEELSHQLKRPDTCRDHQCVSAVAILCPKGGRVLCLEQDLGDGHVMIEKRDHERRHPCLVCESGTRLMREQQLDTLQRSLRRCPPQHRSPHFVDLIGIGAMREQQARQLVVLMKDRVC
jgi:hypothetical protein